jgi:hypothetical protein
MSDRHIVCPDCDSAVSSVNRRDFIRVTSASAAVAAVAGPALLRAADEQAATPETLTKKFFDSLSEKQRAAICFDWDYVDEARKFGTLRTRVANNWHITPQTINSDFYTKDQRELAYAIWQGIIHPDWHQRVQKQIEGDNGGPWGGSQNIAIFGQPGNGKFELVMTGRHMTVRCDGNSTEHVAFGGPIFYGHAAGAFDEEPNHPGNVYWEQALEANKVYEMLDGKQRAKAEVPSTPVEQRVGFKGEKGPFPGIAVTDLTADQKEQVQKTLQKLIEPYRQSDRDEVVACLKAQGGLDKCSLAFFTDEDLGEDKIWDNWRLEGPSFVWYFRGSPHVHVWVNVAADSSVKTNA